MNSSLADDVVGQSGWTKVWIESRQSPVSGERTKRASGVRVRSVFIPVSGGVTYANYLA